MSYVPINLHAFTAAYSGAVSGMAVSGWITNPTPSNYQLVTQIAGAFAKAFDQTWNNPVVNEADEFSIISVCQSEFIGRGPGPLSNPTFQDPANWAVPAAACAALVLEGDAYFTSQGITPPAWPPGSGVGTLIFPNIAALEAFNTATAPQGTTAFVQSNGSFWNLPNLIELAPLTPDGITVVTATPAGQWWRTSDSGYLQHWLNQANWVVDPQNVSGHASDENVGTSGSAPLLHVAEIYRRWGFTWSPTIGSQGLINMVVQYISASLTNGSDPALFEPNLLSDSTFAIMAALPATPAMTATLTAVSPKNTTAGTAHALQVGFNLITGVPGTNMLLVNTSKGNSRAFVQRSPLEAVWQISQPCTPYSGPPARPPYDGAPEVDTWANGDNIQGFFLLDVDIGVVGGLQTEATNFSTMGFTVWQVNLLDPAQSPVGVGKACTIHAEVFYAIVECSFGNANTNPRSISYEGTTEQNPIFFNSALGISTNPAGNPLQNFIFGEGNAATVFSSGLIATDFTSIISVQLWNDAILNGSFGIIRIGNSDTTVISPTCIDGSGVSNVVQGRGFVRIVSGGFFYGDTGASYNSQGLTTYDDTGVSTFRLGGGIAINGSTSAYSFHSTGGVTQVDLVPLTPANLDAAAGPAGFGGVASLAGASIQKTGVTPP